MTTAQKDAEATKEYRVVTAGITYISPVEGFAPDGSEATLRVYLRASRGDIVELTEKQANRLSELGPIGREGKRRPAVKLVDEDRTYDEMGPDEMDRLISERGIDVVGTGANGALLDEDRINALYNYDQGGKAEKSKAAKSGSGSGS